MSTALGAPVVPRDLCRGEQLRTIRFPDSRGSPADDDGCPQSLDDSRSIVAVAFPAGPGECVVVLRLVSRPELRKPVLYVLEGHAFNFAAVDLAHPLGGLRLKRPGAPQHGSDIVGATQRACDERGGRRARSRPSNERLQLIAAGLRQRDIERATQSPAPIC